MNKFRCVLMSVAMLVGASAFGAAKVNTLIINRTDGKIDKIAMHQDLDVSLNDKGEILMVHPEVTVAYPLELVKSFTPGYYTFTSGNYYSGDHQVDNGQEDAIVAPENEGVSVIIDRETIAVSGLKGSLLLVDMHGKTIRRSESVDGQAQIAIGSLADGVYVLIADKTTLKIRI